MNLKKEKKEVTLAALCKQIVDTKWWEVSKRNRLYNQALKYSRENKLDF